MTFPGTFKSKNPCNKCGSFTRYESNKTCVKCRVMNARQPRLPRLDNFNEKMKTVYYGWMNLQLDQWDKEIGVKHHGNT